MSQSRPERETEAVVATDGPAPRAARRATGGSTMGLVPRLRTIRLPREFGLLVIVVAAFVTLSIANVHFFTKGNLVATTVGMSPILIVSVGMTIALISGGFDLSVGGVVALSSVVMAYYVNVGMAVGMALAVAILVSLGVGLLNGLLIAVIGINPLITTLGTLGIARGIAEIVSQGTTISPDPVRIEGWFTWFGNSESFGVPNLVFIVFALVLVGDVLVRKARAARSLFLLGGNERAARFVGMNVARVQISVFLITALLSAAAGLLLVSRFGIGTAQFGIGYELQAIAAAVIGGASLKGGQGSLLGVFLATWLLAMIGSALVLYEVSVYYQDFITGAILVIAVAVTLISERKSLLVRR